MSFLPRSEPADDDEHKNSIGVPPTLFEALYRLKNAIFHHEQFFIYNSRNSILFSVFYLGRPPAQFGAGFIVTLHQD